MSAPTIFSVLLPHPRSLRGRDDLVTSLCGCLERVPSSLGRRRVRTLTVCDFPFLREHPRPAGALSLRDGVVSCLTCSESLSSQWKDYERMRVPVEMRKYNWMVLPPPPEETHGVRARISSRLFAEFGTARRLKWRCKLRCLESFSDWRVCLPIPPVHRKWSRSR